jgi:hypothetical protein
MTFRYLREATSRLESHVQQELSHHAVTNNIIISDSRIDLPCLGVPGGGEPCTKDVERAVSGSDFNPPRVSVSNRVVMEVRVHWDEMNARSPSEVLNYTRRRARIIL